jgi:hypothetical protein
VRVLGSAGPIPTPRGKTVPGDRAPEGTAQPPDPVRTAPASAQLSPWLLPGAEALIGLVEAGASHPSMPNRGDRRTRSMCGRSETKMRSRRGFAGSLRAGGFQGRAAASSTGSRRRWHTPAIATSPRAPPSVAVDGLAAGHDRRGDARLVECVTRSMCGEDRRRPPSLGRPRTTTLPGVPASRPRSQIR